MTGENGNGTIRTTQTWEIGDGVKLMQEVPEGSVDIGITSPPYWGLRDYGVVGQIGLEPTLNEYHDRLLEVTAELYRVIKPTGVLFWNHGDSYYAGGGKAVEKSYKRETAIATGAYPHYAPPAKFRNTMGKCLTLQNERLITRMIDEQGWILRNRIIWDKPNGMPSSVKDRFSNKYEPVYMLVKQKKYWFDLDAVRKPYTEPMNRWGGPKLKANGKSEWDAGTGQPAYRERDMRPNPFGKNPGDVVEMTQVEWMDYCAELWDVFAEAHGDIMHISTQPYKESHFATFPTTLIEPLIKAACPTEICPECGHIRERITEKFDFGRDDTNSAYTGDTTAGRLAGKRQAYRKMGLESPPAPKTVGWTSCDCEKGWIAGTVIDPFCGSGTVLKVCRLLNLNAIGYDINPEYAQMMNERSMTHTPPLGAYL